MKTFMLLLAFTLTEPDGTQRDEIVNVLSRHFDSKPECTEFVIDWEETIRSRGLDAVQDMLRKDWKVELTHIGCAEKPDFKKTTSVDHQVQDDPDEMDHQ